MRAIRARPLWLRTPSVIFPRKEAHAWPYSPHGAMTGRSRIEVGKGEERCALLIAPESRMDQVET